MALINYIFNHKNGSNKFHLCLKSSKNNIIVPRGEKKKKPVVLKANVLSKNICLCNVK